MAMNGPINALMISISSFLINVRPDYVVLPLIMSVAKIHLSEEELRLAQNADVLLTKNRIIQKAYDLFGILSEELKSSQGFPSEAVQYPPKISKGENYLGLPWVILDYPRLFSRDEVFAIRTMFWWGNFISVTLQLKGKFTSIYGMKILHHHQMLSDHNFYLCIENDEWRHEFRSDNYIPFRDANLAEAEKHLVQKSFCKIAARIPVGEWNNAYSRIMAIYSIIVGVIES